MQESRKYLAPLIVTVSTDNSYQLAKRHQWLKNFHRQKWILIGDVVPFPVMKQSWYLVRSYLPCSEDILAKIPIQFYHDKNMTVS